MRRLGFAFLVLIPLSIAVSFLTWFLTPTTELNILLLDKTMVNEDADEHRALTWLLQHEGYAPPGGRYEPGEAHVGFLATGEGTYSITGFETRDSADLVALAREYDGAYVADGYGIYEITWHQEYPDLGPITEPARKIYGGMHPNDMIVLHALEEQGKPIIAEFSTLGPPTPPDVRADLEKLLGVKWSGWTGKFFETLDSTGSDLPDWIVANFMKQSGGSWPFHDAPGVVLSHLDERIVILRFPEDLELPSPQIAVTFDQRSRFDAPVEPLPYTHWFDIVQPDTNSESLAYVTLPTKGIADTLLNAFGIPRIFPAVIERTDKKHIFYFAGDFSDYPPVNELLSHFAWVRALRAGLYTDDNPISRSEFYWTLYYPMVRSILRTSFVPQ